MNSKIKGALRAEVRAMKKRLAYILGVSVREIDMRASEEGLCLICTTYNRIAI